jgi:hypothetical protein
MKWLRRAENVDNATEELSRMEFAAALESSIGRGRNEEVEAPEAA